VVVHGKIVTEPFNLGRGWVGFDFRKAFGRPTLLMNDAAMQAIGSYEAVACFFWFGHGLGSALIVDGTVAPMELAHSALKRGRSYEDYLGDRGRRRLGPKSGVASLQMWSRSSVRRWKPTTLSSAAATPAN